MNWNVIKKATEAKLGVKYVRMYLKTNLSTENVSKTFQEHNNVKSWKFDNLALNFREVLYRGIFLRDEFHS